LCPDTAGQTPLDYAVRHGHVAVVKSLILECKLQMNESELLATAISSRFVDVSIHLINDQCGLHFISRSGETVLHIAAEQGLVAVVKALVSQTSVHNNSQEDANGWTPLIIACVQGHCAIVETLLQAGADASICDHRGWLAKDHALYLGYPIIADAIKGPGSLTLPTKAGKPIGATTILPRRSLADSVIFINLGTQDLYKEVVEVDLAPYRSRIWPVQVPDSGLILSISLGGHEHEKEYRVALPIISDTYDWPYCFTTRNPDSAVIVFRVFRASEEKAIGTAVALLTSLHQGLGPKRESLVRDFTIPLVSDETGQVGSVVFTFLIARPLNPEVLPTTDAQNLKQEARIVLGGHRGNGRNDKTSRSLQIGENTLKVRQMQTLDGAFIF
jgi:glycerophosphodiester phosphodiesterase